MDMGNLWSVIVDAGLKSAVLCAGGLLVAGGVMRRSSAARRHVVYAGVLVACLLLPVLSLLLPQWRVLPQWPAAEVQRVQVATPVGTPPAGPLAAVETPVASAPAPVAMPVVPPAHSAHPAHPVWYTRFILTQWLTLVWLVGSIACLLPIVLGQLAILRIRRSARPMRDALCSVRCRMPMACGLLRPAIILPEEAYTWPVARREAVIRHEAEHLRRWDCLWQQLGQFARALYWFNPLIWFAHHRMLCEAERACDDAVLTEGSKPSDYAEHLLAVATTGRSDLLLASAGVAMARSTSLEGRLLSILDAARSRHAVTRGVVCLCIAVLLGIATPLAMLRAQTPPAPAPSLTSAATTRPASQATFRVIFGDSDVILANGKPTTWKELPEVIAANPPGKVPLEMASVSDDIPLRIYRNAQGVLTALVKKYPFAYLSDTGRASEQEVAAYREAAAHRPAESGAEGINLTLKPAVSLANAPVFQLEPGDRPILNWSIDKSSGPVDYLAIIVVPADRPDLGNIPQSKLWQLANVPDKWAWGAVNIPPSAQSVAYGQDWAQTPQVVVWHAPEALETGYYALMVMGYQGKFRQGEGREPVTRAFAALKVGNPPEAAKPDYSKLTPEQMQAKVQEWVEDFFAANYRDITARKTIKWGPAQKAVNGNWQIAYKYEAEIWHKDKLVQEKLFEFTPDGGFVSVQDAGASQSAGAPRVVSTEPANMAKDVPVTLKEIKVTFDRPMSSDGFSFVGGGPAFPKTTDKAHWVDERTCVLPVQLEGGHDYWLQINNSTFQAFRSKEGRPAVPYPIWFQTAGGKPQGPPIVAETTPKDGATDVDPSITEIRVSFSQPMSREGMSWVGGGESFPQSTGKPRWIDDRTCVMPVKLLPNHEYHLAFNSSTFVGFCGQSGVPSLPSTLSFKTKAAAPAKPVSAQDRAKADELAKEGWTLWQQQQYAPASDRFGEAVKLNPNATNAWNGLGWALFNSGRIDEARDAFAKCIALAPNHPAALNGLGQVELQQGDLAQAEKHLLAASPTASAAWWGLAKVYLVQGKYDEAAKWTDRILKEDPSNAEAQQLKAAAQQKRLPDVLQDLKAKWEEKGKADSSPALDHIVPVKPGRTSFLGRDSLIIREVRGTADTMATGNTYQITGTYRLQSREHASIGAFITVSDPAEGTSPIAKGQMLAIDKGEGTFTLTLPMKTRGEPHVSFYPAEGGESFGGVYFDTPQAPSKDR